MKIGIGVLTHKRNNALKQILPVIKDTVTSNNVNYFVSINASNDIDSDKESIIIANDYGFSSLIGNNSVSVGKNRILKYFYNMDVDYIFIIEDDFLPQSEGWDEIYSGDMHRVSIHHIQHIFEFNPLNDMPIIKNDVEFNVFKWINGSLMIFSKHCINTIGGFDERFNVFGHEHIEYMERAKLAMLHVIHKCDPLGKYFFDLHRAKDLFKEMPKIESSIPMKAKMRYIRSNDSVLRNIRNNRDIEGLKRELI